MKTKKHKQKKVERLAINRKQFIKERFKVKSLKNKIRKQKNLYKRYKRHEAKQASINET